MELAAARPELVRRLVLAGVPADRSPTLKQPRLVLDAAECSDALLEAASMTLVRRIGAFLGARD